MVDLNDGNNLDVEVSNKLQLCDLSLVPLTLRHICLVDVVTDKMK